MNQQLEQAIRATIKAGSAIMEVYAIDFSVDMKSDNSPVTIADIRAHDLIVTYLNQTVYPIISEEGRDVPYFKREAWDTFWLVDPLDGTKEFVSRNDEFTVNIALIKNHKPIMGVIYAPVQDLLYFSDDMGAWKLERSNSILDASDNLDTIKSKSIKLPLIRDEKVFTIVTSRSHLTTATAAFINKNKNKHDEIKIVSRGSSLKLCMIAEGLADVYPRFGTTSEWDIAAGHAIISAAGGRVVVAEEPEKDLVYNKQSLKNPSFIAYASKPC